MVTLEKNALVWGIVGNLGGGKTLTSVAVAVECLRKGYAIVSNVTLDIKLICKTFNIPWAKKLYTHISLDDENFDPFDLPCGDPRGSGGKRRVIIIFDEVAEWIDQYTSIKTPRIALLHSWLRLSSKRSQDVFFICQRREYINKSFRSLIVRWLWVDDLAVYKIPTLKVKIPFCSSWVMVNQFDRLDNRIAKQTFLKKSFYGQFYNTAECLNIAGSLKNSIYTIPEETYKPNFIFLFLHFTTILYLIKTIIKETG